MLHKHRFLKITGSAGLAPAPLLGLSSQEEPQLAKIVLQEFVGASHGKVAVVKARLEEHPKLIDAAHDWKNRDFAKGLGAASHLGHKELVQYLLSNGAQASIFTDGLFGKIDLVKPMLTAFPYTLNAKE